ncbi:hypothetical protein Btru_022886 [Bulinus truncatus]|nr:hypothetical protein Btru_022886 [Bulinus truncatus]
MPPIGQMDLSNLSDSELSVMLRDYGVNVGPINMATRKTYERKLLKLKTGQESPPSHGYTPVDDDDDEEDEDDEEVQIRQPVRRSPVATEISQPRLRKETPDLYSTSSKVESRPSLSTSRKITTSYTPASSQTVYSDKRIQKVSGGIPLWVKIVCVAVILIFVFLIYTNLEPTVQNEIQSISSTVEV